MIQYLERLILSGLIEFYSLGILWGIFTLGIVTVVLLILQFQRQKETIIPGIFACTFGFLQFLHLFKQEVVRSKLTNLLELLGTPHNAVTPVTLFGINLEPIFTLLVAPVQARFLHEEMLFVLLATYLVFVVLVSIREYKKTGTLLGDLNFLPHRAARRPKRSQTNELGSGDLANEEQILNWTRPTGKSGDTTLPASDLRGSGGVALKQGRLILPAEERNRHVLIIAKTGSGKTTRLIFPIVYNDCMDPVRSTIIIDSKPEMWRKFAAMTQAYNPQKKVMLFNPLDTLRSLSWNILGKIENDTDAKLIANTIVMATDNPSSKGDSPFFRNNALAILNSIMVGLLHDPNDKLSMPRIHELVQGGMKPLAGWLEAHPEALRNTRTFVELIRSGSQNADTIMSELSMRLAAWDLKAIRSTTFMDELNLEDIIQHPSLFVIELRESELEMLRPMANVIVVEMLRFLTKRAESFSNSRLPRPVGLVIDEFASALGRIPDIHVKLNTLRSRNVSIVAAVQSLAQIKANYSENADSVIAGFSTKIFMPSLDNSDSEWASKETGQMTIRFQTASTGNNKKIVEFFASKNDSKQEQVQQRAVLTPDEIGRPADNISTFFLPNTPVFQGHLVPYFKVPDMAKRIAEFDADERELKLRSGPIEFVEAAPKSGDASGAPAATAGATGTGLPPGISDTRGWTDDQVWKKYEEVREKLDWKNTTGSARKWWETFEAENKARPSLVLRLAEELATRTATVTEFFLAYVYSNTDNIQANLNYFDYLRLKKEEEKKKRAATEGGQKQAA